jgi:hypothetical protein
LTLPLVIGLAFSFLALAEKRRDDAANYTGMIAAAISAVTWFIYGSVWTYCFPTLPWLNMGYLWFAFGFIFALLATAYVVQYVWAGFKRKQSEGTLTIRETDVE